MMTTTPTAHSADAAGAPGTAGEGVDSPSTTGNLADNPLLRPSALPYGLPEFELLTDDHVLPALEEAMRRHRAEIDAIVGTAEEPTVANTIDALERSGQDLDRVIYYFFNMIGPDATPERMHIDATLSPTLAAHYDELYLNDGLFSRISSLYERRDDLHLEGEQRRVVEHYFRTFTRRGAALDAEAKARMKAINERLSTLSTEFSEALLEDTRERAVHVFDEDELAGVSADQKSFFAETAASRGVEGWVIPLGLPTMQPVLAEVEDRSLRQRLHEASISRGQGRTEDIVLEIVRLRAEAAQLLGYRTHADYVADEETAGTADAARRLLRDLTSAAMANADGELKELIDASPNAECEPYDWPALAEKVQAERFQLESSEVKKYLNLENVLVDGVFYAASVLYDLEIARRPDLKGYAEGTEVWEVRQRNAEAHGREADAEDGSAGIGLLVTDYFARETKRGGAWMSSFVEQNHLRGERPVVVNVQSIAPAAPGEPVLLSLDEVQTLFHEFGHGLHGLLSDVHYPVLSGTNVPRDFVEYPSQLNEMWTLHKDVLPHYAKNAQGETIPEELVEKIRESRTFGQGRATTEYLAAASLDLAWHSLTLEEAREVTDVAAFEAAALEAAGLAHAAVPPRYRTTYFQHLFTNGYSAAYYAYLWAEVLDADTVAWINEHGGLSPEAGEGYRKAILSRGATRDYMQAYREFRGRDKDVQPLLDRRGLSGAAVDTEAS